MEVVSGVLWCGFFFFFKQKTAYEIGTGDWSSDVCSSDLITACGPLVTKGRKLNCVTCIERVGSEFCSGVCMRSKSVV